MKEYNFLAFDIGATSGRAMMGSWDGVRFDIREIHRFPNPMVELGGKYYWNIYDLYASLLEGLSICARQGISLCSIGIDTWGVDFGFIAPDGSLLGLPRSYRDPFTEGAPEEYFTRIPREEVYGRTGIQVMPFNSLFQLFRMADASFIPQETASKLLFIPDLLGYMLTGQMVCEYTIASTSQVLNPVTRQFDEGLLESVKLSAEKIGPVVMPGTLIGHLSGSIAKKTGVGEVPVIAVAGHDTASAVTAVPAGTSGFAYLSSGTWSLMGIEVEEPIINEASYRHNFTNEGGIEGTTRFLKNITGMWLLERCREEWKRCGVEYSYPDIVWMAGGSDFGSLVNPDDPCFSNPISMMDAIDSYCERTGQPLPSCDADYIRCIFYSLANRYKEVLEILSGMSPFKIDCLHVIGGGSQNDLLNQLTADAIGIPVVAGPSEATAIGNCLIQAKAAGLVKDRREMREWVGKAFVPRVFDPQEV